MPKKKVSDQSEVVSAGDAPIDKPVKAAKKAKGPVEQVVEKAMDVEKVVEKVLKRAAKRPSASTLTPTPPVPPVADSAVAPVDASSEDLTFGESLMTDVVFRLHADSDVRDMVLVGDFNGWSQTAHPMTRDGDAFQLTVPLERGRRYRYRYLVDGHHWENDWNADEYVPNEYGGDDSVRIV